MTITDYTIKTLHGNRYLLTVTILASVAALHAHAQTPNFSRVIVDSGSSGDVKATGDIDGDGFADIVIGGSDMRWYRYPSWNRSIINTAAVEFTTDMQLADIDKDGDLDIVTGDGQGTNNVIWLENPRPTGNPALSWVRHVIGTHGDWAHDIEVADIDRDEKLDIVVRKTNTNVFFQNSPASWTKVDISSRVGGWEGMTLGDIDLDGDPDLVADGAWIEVPANPRLGTWIRHSVASGYPTDTSAAVADINGDGRPDIVFVGQHTRGKMAWYQAPSDPVTGTWTERIIDNNMGSHKLNIGDLNGDGRVDIVAGLELLELSVYTQQAGSSPTFSKQVLSNTGLHNQRLIDIGNDGDLDIIGANWIGHPPLEFWNNQTSTSPSDTSPPSQVTNLTATTNSPSQITLTWTAATDNTAVTGYRIYRCQGASCAPTAQLGTASGITFVDNTVAASTTYRYSVRAFDAAGNLGPQSAIVSAATPASAPPTIASFSASPAAITQGQSSVLSWNVTGATSVSISPGIGTVTGTTSRTVSPASTTTYTLTATNSAGSVSGSTVVSVSGGTPVVSVSVSPTTASLTASQTRQFTATVTGTSNTAVTWSISPTVGSISSSGLYTAPTSITATQIVTVRATSVADPSRSATATVTLNPPEAPAPEGLVAYWPFSEGSGSTIGDASGNGRTATAYSTNWTTGKAGYALNFDGSSSYVNAGAIDVNGSALSISAWFKADAFSSGIDPRIVSKASGTAEGDHYLMLSTANSSGDKLRFRLKTGGTTKTLIASSGTLSTSVWIHAVATYDGSSMRLYKDGVLVGSLAASGSISTNSSVPLWIGSNPVGGNPFDGVIDEVRIYDRALSTAEVVSLYQGAADPEPVSVAVSPGTVSLTASQTLQFTASVTGTSNTAVTWSISPAVGSISSSGLYTAPASITSAQTVTVKATSTTDSSKSDTATVTLSAAVSVVVSPTIVSLTASQTRQFTASVTGTSNTAVTWSISPAVGSISSSGLYTAPASITSAQTVTVKATSTADSFKSDTATVTLNPPVASASEGLVAYWPFREGSGTTIADASGNGITATGYSTTWTIGKVGNALNFNGSTSYVSAGALDLPGSALTVSAWFKADAFASNADSRIISKASGGQEQDHYLMLSTINSGGQKLRFRLKTGGTTKTLIATSETLSAGVWVHVAATYDGSTMRLYKDGVLVGSLAASGSINTNSSVPLWIGSNPVGGNLFDGIIDEVRIYNRSLSAAEIASLYQN